MLQKNTFGQKKFWISCTGLKVPIWQKLPNCQNGTFEPVHEIQNFFWPKVFFWSIMNMPIRKNIHNMPQGPPNPGFMQEIVQKGDFLKKPSWELKFFCCFRFLWISQRPGPLNWEWLVFLLSKILYKQCAWLIAIQLNDKGKSASLQSQTTDTQWRHKSKISEKLGRCGRQNMLRPYLKIWDWDWIFGRAVKAISSLGVRSSWMMLWPPSLLSHVSQLTSNKYN